MLLSAPFRANFLAGLAHLRDEKAAEAARLLVGPAKPLGARGLAEHARRLIAHDDDKVTFRARSRDRGCGNPSECYTLTRTEFIRCWAMDSLPKGFVHLRQKLLRPGRGGSACTLLLCRVESRPDRLQVAGLEFGPKGDLQVIPIPKLQEELTNVKRQEKLLPRGPWRELAEWLHAVGPNRKPQPNSERTMRKIAERERELGTRMTLESALRYDPTVPLARLLLAATIEKDNAAKKETEREPNVAVRAALLRRIEFTCLPSDAALWARAAQILLETPQAKVGIGAWATTCRQEALKAAKKAVEVDGKLPAARETLKQAEDASAATKPTSRPAPVEPRPAGGTEE